MDLNEAIVSGRLPWLLRADPSLATAKDENGVSVLLLARFHRNAEATAALIAAGAPITPLEAAALGEVELLEGADLSIRSGDGFTPLHLAAFFAGPDDGQGDPGDGFPADADAVNRFKVRPIHSAAAAGDNESVAALLEAGANPNVQQQGGYTPLHTAAHNNDRGLIELLLRHGANPALADDEGVIPRDMTTDESVRALFNP